MKYKGYVIEDNEKALRIKEIETFDGNIAGFTKDMLSDIIDEMRSKEDELRRSGIDYEGMTFDVLPIRPPETSEDEIKLLCSISWFEPETQEEHDERIRREIERIDNSLNFGELLNEDEIEKAKELLIKNGYTVNKNG